MKSDKKNKAKNKRIFQKSKIGFSGFGIWLQAKKSGK